MPQFLASTTPSKNLPPRCNLHLTCRVITQRLIDNCLREDLCQLLSLGKISELPSHLIRYWPKDATTTLWLQVSHLQPGQTLWLPVRYGGSLQTFSATDGAWLRVHSQTKVRVEQGHRRWLEHLSQGLDSTQQAGCLHYAAAIDTAIEQRNLCREAYIEQAAQLADILDEPLWDLRQLGIARLASHLESPGQPAGRARIGLSAWQLKEFAPEFAPQLQLNWLAVPEQTLKISRSQPGWWPRAPQVGLDPSVDRSHCLIPVHPLSWPNLERYGLPSGTLRAPKQFLEVEPGLSMHSLTPLRYPHWILRLSLPIHCQGEDWSQLSAGQQQDLPWLQQVLKTLCRQDTLLGDRLKPLASVQVGTVLGHPRLGYQLRQTPSIANSETASLVPIAALASPLPDGHLFIERLVDTYSELSLLRWWRQYLNLLLDTHLRLWLRYGLVLTAGQQHSVLLVDYDEPLRLLVREPQLAALWPERFCQHLPLPEGLPARSRRVNHWQALAERFCTSTLEHNILAPLEALAAAGLATRRSLYTQLQQQLQSCLDTLATEGIDIQEARQFLFDSPKLPVEYSLSRQLLAAAQAPYFGYTAPNFLLEEPPCRTVQHSGYQPEWLLLSPHQTAEQKEASE